MILDLWPTYRLVNARNLFDQDILQDEQKTQQKSDQLIKHNGFTKPKIVL